MTNQQLSKIRLVKCPRCVKILPEPDHIPVYTCGGCGTILQAKYYRRNNGATEGASLQQGHVVDHARDGGETGGSNHRSSPNGEQSDDQNRLQGQSAVENCNSEQIQAANSASHVSSSEEFSNHDDQNRSMGQNTVECCNSEQVGTPPSSHCVSSSELGNPDDPNRLRGQNAVENCNTEQIEATVSILRTSSPEEFSNSDDWNRMRGQNAVENCNPKQIEALITVHRNSSSEELSNVDPNRLRGQNAVKNCNPEQIEAPISVHRTSSSEESCDSDDPKRLKGQSSVENCNSEHPKAPTSAHHTSSSKELSNPDDQNRLRGQNAGKDCDSEQITSSSEGFHDPDDKRNNISEGMTVLRNNNSEKITVAYLVVDDVHRQDKQCDEATVDNHNQKQIENGDSSKDIHKQHESQALESEEPSKLQDWEVNGALHIENDKLSQHFASENGLDHNTLTDTGNEHHKGINLQESLLVDESNCLDSRRPLLCAMVSENGVVHRGSDETSKDSNLEYKPSQENILVNKINSGDIQRSPKITESAKETGNGYHLEDEKLSETPFSTDTTQVGIVDSTTDIESNSRELTGAGGSATSKATKLNTTGKAGFTKVSQVLENVALTDETDCAESIKTHKNVSNSLKEVGGPLTKGSFAYERSASSLDAYDQVPEQQKHFPGETLPEIEETFEWSSVPSRNTRRSSRIQNRPKTSSCLMEENLRSSILEEEKTKEETGIPRRNRIRPNRNRFPPRVPLYWSSEMAYETGSSSSYMHDDLFSQRMHYRPNGYEDSEPWLRKWYSQKGHMDRRKFSEAVWMENEFLPMNYSHETSGEFHHRLERHDYIDRRRRSESWSQIGDLPPKPYSCELFNGRYQNPEPYMHHHPDEFRWSAQLPRYEPPACCRQGLCAGPSRENRWDPYKSYPTRLQQLEESEFYPWTHDRRQKDDVMRRLYLRDKQKAVKTFSRPIAGGAPFVTCYNCFKVLQLPEEFLYPRRKRTATHKVKCGSCSRILEFSLEKASSSAPLNSQAGTGDQVNSNNVAGSSGEPRQMKITWQLPARSKSPLHRLMGYSSPHDLINDNENEVLQ